MNPSHIEDMYSEMQKAANAGHLSRADRIRREITAAEREWQQQQSVRHADPQTAPTAAELRNDAAELETRFINAAKRGDHADYSAAHSEYLATKRELAAAERREMNEADAAHRLRKARADAGMDADGTRKTQGYDSAGDLIADMMRRGPVRFQIEQYLRESGTKPPKRS
ncbi:hypothetical protein [Amycolatopsis pithecellobii]|uniref:Uncharacterized protein n=1 Tax=Amycolatopsis pithecellobii TaxID=664692 RepID=A0A6N7YUT6_9PSEU|nr:hypothetical protein [Amycolatopsis pithecellobii]MTD55702.1 hypothetical protein [Amycolatopsis pithecellobii]